MIARRLSRALPVVAGLVLAAGWLAPAPFGAALNGVAHAQDKDKPAAQPAPKPAPRPPVFLDPIPAKEAVTKFKLPEGFKISLFAAEPDVVQPIAFTIDDRGRLWVVENLSYPTWKETGGDRITIFEDTDNDGTFDKKKIFWDKGRYTTGVLLGFGGVFVCDAPDLLFIPDKNGDDVPDGPPEVLLTGWSTKGKHNVLNALKWGPDGWLYGCNGITAPSMVGKPETPEKERVEINCGVWRWHPTTKSFEVVAHGTTNPWGLDFDEYGQMFITNCVIKHMFHIVPGGHYERMFGNDVNPHSYGLMQSCADHIHWAEGTKWTDSRGGKGDHDGPGGGHAHAGLMIYYGDNWPSEYRGRAFMCNIHGNRVNQDILERKSSGYVAKHARDFAFANDVFFRGLEMQYGPDGGVYITDWCDTGECHDYDTADVRNGRIYKITYGDVKKSGQKRLREMDDVALVGLLKHKNEWFARNARLVLQERGHDVNSRDAIFGLIGLFRDRDELVTTRLRALWALHAIDRADADAIFGMDDENELIRAWCVRLRHGDPDRFSNPTKIIQMARNEKSALVRLELASVLQRLDEWRWPIAEALLAHEEDANDPNIPLMIWYGIEPAVAADKEKAIALAAKAKIPLVRQFIAKRIAVGAEVPKKEEKK